MTQPSLVRELFDLPDHVRKGDYVLRLSEGVARPDETSSTYVVTPAIFRSFDSGLALVGSALRDGRSQSSYVHGSFGSGKSHFMAMLSLLVDDSETAWRIPELHPLRDKHPWVGKKKVLQLRFHMVGATHMEAAVFGEYVRWVRATHPGAPVPPLFADEELFADARTLLERLGEAAFFQPMNEGAAEASDWGELAGTWTLARFEEAAASTDPDVRAKLFNALATTHFRAFASQKNTFVDFDAGLGILARHAKRLGYDAVLLFLDELILWLASGASNAAWLHTEVQNVAKLVEAQDAARDVPLVSFIARQRDLAQLVGEEYAGAENKRLRETLDWFQGRFGTVDLEDRNLPAIVEKRILRPRSAEAQKRLEDAFASLRRGAGNAWSVLLGQEDAEAFRKLYPFSPALVETLVALSSSLQRNRTAIRLLMEILVDYTPDLKLGDTVPVGDLFDVLAGGDDTADGIMKSRFEAAKQLYRQNLLPLLHDTHQTGTMEKCQRLRPEANTSLGCAGCPQTACRNDNRLLKTLLIASLVPEVRSLKDLTAGRLVQLNHGTLRAPIPGTEAQMAAQRLQKWASMVGQIHVGPQADPLVWVTLGTVDLGPIIDQASEADNAGAKQNIVRAMLFSEMGLEVGREWGEDRVIEWNSTKRLGHVRFGNVRRMGEEQLRCPEDHAFRIVIDYPFDDPGFGPNDDLEVVDRVREEGGGSWSLVWLPSFFSEQINKIVGELAKLDHILATRESARHYVAHLRVDQQQPVITDLENLRSQKRARLRSALLQAYGIARQTEGDIDPTRSVMTHLHVLKSDLRIQPLSGGTLHGVVEHYAGKLLELRYPRHPAFPHKLTKQTCERVLEHFSDLVDSEDKRLTLAKDDIGKLRETLGLLGIVSTTETAVHLVEDRTLQLLEQKRAQKAIDHPSVAELRAWLDENGKMGLTFEANDLVVRAYARWSARTFVRYGSPFVVTAGSEIPGDVVLEKPELPSQAEWSAAIELAGHAFGLTLPRKSLFADNVKRFEAELERRASDLGAKASRLAAVVAARAAELGLPADVDRARTAASAQALCAAVRGKKGPEQVRALAAFKAETSPKAVGASLASAASVAQSLENRLVFGVFGQLAARPALEGAAALLDDLRKAVRQDEVHVALAATLETLALRAQDLLRGPGIDPPPPPTSAGPDVIVVVDEGLPRAPTDATRQLARWLSLVSAELEAGHDVTIEGRLRITRRAPRG